VVGGEIPTEIGMIRGTLIAFGNNELRGTIPNEIYQLTDLTTLNLRNNFLSGTISSDIGNLETLSALDLSINGLFGVIPTGTQLGTLQYFSFVFVAYSHSFGSTELGSLTSITAGINLAKNDFSGPLPSEIGSLVAMSKFQ
jgi:Leucine-rich repeat (LRR) protein